MKKIDYFVYYLMILIPTICKGFGFDMNDKIYIFGAALSAILFMFKFLITNWDSKKELFVSIVIILFSGIVTIISRKFSVIMAAFVIVGSKNINLSQAIKVIAFAWIVCFLLNTSMSMIGIKSMDKQFLFLNDTDIDVAYGLGYGHKNQLSIACVITYLSYIYLRFDKIKLLELFFVIFTLIFILSFSKSRLGLVIFFYITAIFLLIKLKNRSINSMLKSFFKLLLPFCVSFSFLTSLLFRKFDFIYKINALLNNRVWMGNLYLEKYPFSLFGNNLEMISGSFLDNAYISIYCRFGIILFVCIMILYQLMIIKLTKRNCFKELILVSSFLIMGIIEEFFMNPFMNISLVLVCMNLYNVRLVNPNKYDCIYQYTIIGQNERV